ncbi:uncharacterized protein LOC119978049 [Scyliorhinus canicula]|uniref:uncharacterized protein LOC119978049 n=1 Tax=Scyliorhinus canicula TaxID=7830 RepID=UPI0018F6C1E6|nr:uncharacterized protein LOC119978049 [Scyliorhinus canicula]XP_038675322.1 uncharacterized protein LOC119978049 [Scyliorhinus canicula]XP_038675323.1 uncharacterized protein LOC119978049 [Scyliorhinus canicula]XP_038675324.1 uncharacterized protein LOC119978049 [Scyliorhinus canicula]XP_038675325.1 uncharacterized protein LOC119978049 [Scyliorhinus canicula]
MTSQETLHNVTDLSNSFTSTHTPSDNGNSTRIDHNTFTKLIEAEHLISRCVYVYSVFGLVGFLTGIFIFVIYGRNYRQKKKFEQLDIILFSLTVADFTLILFSLTDVVRPEAVFTTALGCGVLSFFFNVPYFYTGYTHIMIFLLVSNRLALVRKVLNKWFFSIMAAMSLSIFFSILVTALTGVGQDASTSVNCHVDPLEAPAEYGIVKLIFGFLIPTLIILGFILQDFRKRVCPHWIFLALVTVTFICRLIYNILLLRRQQLLKKQSALPELMVHVTIGELVMFSGSCLCLVCIAVFHKMKKETMYSVTEPTEGSMPTETTTP